MKNARHEAIAPYVDDALRNGESFFPLKGSDNVKSLQKFVHKRAGKGKVKTYQNTLRELVILRLQEDPIASDFPLATLSAIETNKWKHPIQVPYEFKVGDAGITACGEKYVVLEKKKDGRLLVSVKSLGSWNIGLRNSDGTCIYNYTNKHRFALLPPEKQLPAIQKRTIYVNVYEDDVFCYSKKEYAEKRIRWRKALCPEGSEAIAVAVPVTFEFTPLR